MHHKESILKFWKNKKNDFPELHAVACVINGLPPTQATVERSFSVLALIYNNRRSQLSQNMLENILRIKLNAEIVSSIFEFE